MPAPTRTETILLVEDVPRVRQVVSEMLTAEGYTVLEAASGSEALEVTLRHPGLIHLMLTDVMMPRINGRELAEQLALLRPEVKVVYMSGYTDPAILPHGVLKPGTVFVMKPFSAELLTGTVRRVLDQ